MILNKLAVAILVFASFGWAGTITLNLPTISTAYYSYTAGTPPIVSGTQMPLTVTIASLPTVAYVRYIRDGQIPTGTSCTASAIFGEPEAVIRTAPYSYVFDPFYFGNGVHTLTVAACDITNTLLAQSTPVQIQVENNLPQNTCPPNGAACTDISVTTGSVAQIIPASIFATVSSVVSFTGSGAITPVGADHVAASGVVTFTATAGNMIACFARWQTNTATAAVTDTKGNTWNAATLSSRSGFSGQWFYTTGGIAAGSTTITVTTTPTQTVLATQCKELNGASTTSPLDVNFVANSSSGAALTSPVFTLASPVAQEFIMFGATWTGTSTATAAPGYTLVTQDSSLSTATEYIAPPSNSFSNVGFNVTVNGPNSGITKSFKLSVDGCTVLAASTGTQTNSVCNPTLTSTTSATQTMVLNTALFQNGTHNVLINVSGGNCPSCVNGVWDIMGEWENQGTGIPMTFSNGAATSQLLMTYRDVTLCVTPTTNCPSSIVENAIVQNSDGTTGTASSYSWTINYNSVGGVFPSPSVPITLSSTTASSSTVAVVAGMQNNSVSVTVTAVTTSGTLSRTFWVKIPPDAVGAFVPHFNAAGQFVTNGISSTDIRPSSAFFASSNGANPYGLNSSSFPPFTTNTLLSGFNYTAQYLPAYVAAGFTLMESGVPTLAGHASGTTEVQFDNYADNIVATNKSLVNTYGLAGVITIGDSWMSGTPTLFDTSSATGPGGAFNVYPATYYLNKMAAQGVLIIGSRMVDEVSTDLPANPYAGVPTGGVFPYSGSGPNPNGFISIDCTVSPARVNTTLGVWGGFINPQTFIVHGSTAADAAGINYNFASGNATAFTATNIGGGVYTFPRPSGCSTLHNFANDPTIQIEPLVAYTFAASTASPNPFAPCPPGGAWGGPCPNYTAYDAIYQLRQQILASTAPFKMATPDAAGGTGSSVACWAGKTPPCPAGPVAGDYDFFYWSGDGAYLADHGNLTDLINSQGNGIRSRYIWNNLGAPMASEVEGVIQDYMSQGFPISVASCAGSTITTTQPHVLYNVTPGNTRLSVVGSSSANCDGKYFAITGPTATTIAVTLANTIPTTAVTGATITFSPSGAVYTGVTINSSTQVSGVASNQPATLTGISSPTIANHRGETFTCTSGCTGAYTGFVGYLEQENLNAIGSNTALNIYYRQVPNITASTGGTAQIIRNHNLLRGDNWPSNSESGAPYMFASNVGSLIWGVSQVSAYQENGDPNLLDLTLTTGSPKQINAWQGGNGYYMFNVVDFNCNYTACPQAGIDPRSDYAKNFAAWTAEANANWITAREIPYAFGQRLPAPDYGEFYEAAAWTAPRGNMLAVQSFADAPTTLTVNTSAYLVGGNNFYQLCGTWDSIFPVTTVTAGTTSVSLPLAPGEHCALIFPNNASTEMQFPTMSVRLADIPSATAIYVQFAYSPLVFQQTSSAGLAATYQTYNCVTGVACQLPFDLNIGKAGNRYYRLIYVDVNGKVLATGDVQTL